MLQHDEPNEFVIGPGVQHTVRNVAEGTFPYVGLYYRDHVMVIPQLRRLTDVENLIADPEPTNAKLQWKPRSTFAELIQEMVEEDLEYVPHEGR